MFALILSAFVVIFIGYQIWWSDSKALQNVDPTAPKAIYAPKGQGRPGKPKPGAKPKPAGA